MPRRTNIPYDMFDIEKSAEEARRWHKCERIYHRGQELAWDGKAILAELEALHGGIRMDDPVKRKALERIFAIILWGELAAWRISLQLADGLQPMEARMAATSQAHDEARHFFVMHDYLTKLGYVPERMDRAPEALLDLVLNTDNLAYKLLGMQLMVETIALTVFQTVREAAPEPVITELMRYYERDEARHVGLGMQYLPSLMKGMNRRELSRLITFQARIMFWAMWETKVLAPDFVTLGIEPRQVLERGRRKQMAAMQSAFDAIGLPIGRERNLATATLDAAAEYMFPLPENSGGRKQRWTAAWDAFWSKEVEQISIDELDVHAGHEIKTARGGLASSDKMLT